MYRSRIADVSSLQIFFFSFASFASYLRRQREFQNSTSCFKPRKVVLNRRIFSTHHFWSLSFPCLLKRMTKWIMMLLVFWNHQVWGRFRTSAIITCCMAPFDGFVENRWDAWSWLWPGDWFECKCAFAFEQEKHWAETLAEVASPTVHDYYDDMMDSCDG